MCERLAQVGPDQIIKKVLVIGPGGAGKSTFARRLGELLDIRVKHLDTYYWRAGWQMPEKSDWLQTVTELASGDAWIMDGNFGGTLDLRIKYCDTIVFLDMSRVVCLWRVLKRRILYRNRSRPDMAEGCNEKIDWDFVQWIWNYSSRSRPKVVRLLKEHSESKRIVWLRSNAEVEKFLWTLRRTHSPKRSGTIT
jgi:adenylate kinase family enzyme